MSPIMPGVFTQSSSCVYGSAPASANPATTTAPTAVCAAPARYGERWRGWMRPSTGGSSPSSVSERV